MKHIAVVSVLTLVGIFILASTASAVTWETYLEDITVPSGTVDISLTYWFNGTGTTGNYSNITLPCNVWGLTNASTTFSIHATANQSFNLTVNGNSVNSSTTLNWTLGNWSNTTVSDWSTTETDQYLNLSFESNITSNTVEINVVANDVAFSSAGLSTYIAIAESIQTAPEIDDEQAHSYFAVKDRVVVTNALGYTITDITLNLTYPSQAITEPYSSVNITSLANSAISYNNISYQKYGPYVTGTISEDIDGDDHEVIIRVTSHEVLTRLVDWDFDETTEDYEDYFATIDYDSLEIELNGVDIDWDEGSVEMGDMTLVDGINKFEFTWTEAEAPVVPPAPGAWDWLYEDHGTGVAIWLWMTITIVIACIIIAVIYAKKK